MSTYQVPIIDRKQVAERTTELSLNISGKEFSFKPGQYLHLAVQGLIAQDPRGNGRDFSISSSPNDRDTLSITFRNSPSGFKKSILELETGSLVEISGPFGSFTLAEDGVRPVVCVAGGIGITPFLSIARYAAQNRLPHKITILYVNRDEESRPYRKELDEYVRSNPNLSVQYLVGKVTQESFKDVPDGGKNALWYVAGPEGMVQTSLAILSQMGIPQEAIRTEEFSGYRGEGEEKVSLHEEAIQATIHSFALGSGSSAILPTDLNALLRAMDAMSIVSQTDAAGNIVYVNNKFIEVSQYSREELIGKNHRILKSGFHPQTFYEDMWHNYLLKGRVWRGEIKNRAKDGSFYWVDGIIVPVISGNGKLLGYVSMRFVITEKKSIEERLMREKEYFQTLSENSTDMVTVIGKDGTVSYASPSFASILGYFPEELRGRKIFDHMHNEDLPGIHKTFEKVVGEPEKTHTVEFRFLHKDGTWRAIEAMGKNLLDNPVITGIVCNCRDVTERKEAEEALKAKTKQLEEANRLMVGRELRMVELKEELENLKKKSETQ